jgi:hypothetical protein
MAMGGQLQSLAALTPGKVYIVRLGGFRAGMDEVAKSKKSLPRLWLESNPGRSTVAQPPY